MAYQEPNARPATRQRRWPTITMLIVMLVVAPALGAGALWAVRQFLARPIAEVVDSIVGRSPADSELEASGDESAPGTTGDLPQDSERLPPLGGKLPRGGPPPGEEIDLLVPPHRIAPQADDLFASGDFAAAARLYREALAESGTKQDESWAYRLALCDEFSGQTDEALARFRELSSATSAVIRFAAHLGMARLWLRQGYTDQAATELSYLIAHARRPEIRLSGIAADALYLSAHSRASEALFGMPRDLLDPDCVAGGAMEPTAMHLWQVIQVPVAGEEPSGSGGPPLRIVGRPKSHPDFVTVTATLAPEQIVRILDAMTLKLEISLEFTDAAANAMRGRVAELDLQDLSFSAFLDLLTEPYGLSWIYVDEKLKIFAESELSLGDRREVLTQRAERTLRSVLAFYPEQELAAVAYLDLANLAFFAGNYEQAISYYQEIKQRYPLHELTQTAWFNLAKTMYHLRNFVPAADACTQVVDRRAGSELESAAYLMLGRMAYEQNDLRAAIRSWGRAASHARDLTSEGHAAVSLAAAHALAGENASANQVLMDHRKAISQDRFRDAAALVSSLARFRLAGGVESRNRAGRQLAAALIHARPADFVGRLGVELISVAYTAFGRASDAIRVLREALADGIGLPIDCRLALQVADYLIALDQFDDCEQYLAAVVDSDKREWAFRGAVRLARLKLLQGEYEQCLASCRDVLDRASDEAEKASVLRIMGSAYEQLGQHQKAAMAFAGMMEQPTSAFTESGVLGR